MHQYNPPAASSFSDFQEIDVITSRDCTLRCTYCYLQKHPDLDYSIPKIVEGLDRVLQDLETKRKDSENNPKVNVTSNVAYKGIVLGFYPEPWANIPRTDKLIRECLKVVYKYPYYAERFMLSLGTNGVRLDQVIPVTEHLLHNTSIAVTIDGVKEAHDKYRLFANGAPSWDIVKRNILKYQQKYNIYRTKITLGPDTLKYVYDDMVFCFEELHFNDIHMNVVFEDLWGTFEQKQESLRIYDEQLAKCYDYIVKNRLWETGKYFSPLGSQQLPTTELSAKAYCGAGVMRSVDTTGDIYPCFRLSPYSLQERTTFKIDTEGNAKALNMLNALDSAPIRCRNCWLHSSCPMCVGGAYEEGGSLFYRTIHHCEFQQIQAHWAYKLFVEMNKEEIIQSGNPIAFMES